MKEYMLRIPVQATAWVNIQAESRDAALKLASDLCDEISISVDPDEIFEGHVGYTAISQIGEIEISDENCTLVWRGHPKDIPGSKET